MLLEIIANNELNGTLPRDIGGTEKISIADSYFLVLTRTERILGNFGCPNSKTIL